MYQDLKQRITCFMEQSRLSNFYQVSKSFWIERVRPNADFLVLAGLLVAVLYLESSLVSNQAEALARLDQFIGDGNRVTGEDVGVRMATNRAEVEGYILASEGRLKEFVHTLIQEECH